MLGQIQEWFYHDLTGIQNANGSAGFKHIVIAPQPVGNVTWVKASYHSIRGKIVSDWKRDGEKFTLNATIPPNTTAMIFIPAKSREAVAPIKGATFLRMETGRAVFATGSGEYSFRSKN